MARCTPTDPAGRATPLLLWARHGRLPAQAPGRAERPRWPLRDHRAADPQLRRRRRGGAGDPGRRHDRPRRRDLAVAGRLRRAGRRDLPRDEHRARLGRRLRPGHGGDRARPRSSPASSTRCRRCRRPTEGADELENFLAALQDQVAAYDRYITALERGDDTAAAEIAGDDRRGGVEGREGGAGGSASRSAATPRRSASPAAASEASTEEGGDTATEAPADDHAGRRP